MPLDGVVVLPQHAAAVLLHVQHIVRLLRCYSQLINCYVVDFFVDDLWQHVPRLWQRDLQHCRLHTVAQLISGRQGVMGGGHVLSLSLLSFSAACHALSLSRDSVAPETVLSQLATPPPVITSDVTSPPHEMWRRVKAKKRHEIERLAVVVKQLTPQGGAVVDVGGGCGHLARYLTLTSCSLAVTSVDCHETLTCSARLLDARVLKSRCGRSPRHVTAVAGQHMRCLCDVMPVRRECTAVALHACGALSVWALRQLAKCSCCSALVLVCCCYMKNQHRVKNRHEDERCHHGVEEEVGGGTEAEISRATKQVPPSRLSCGSKQDTHNRADNDVFPVSSALLSVCSSHCFSLTYEARELACHAIEAYEARLRASPAQQAALKVHAFRAALQRLLCHNDKQSRNVPTTNRRRVHNVHYTDNLTFSEYVARALCVHEAGSFSAEQLAAAEKDLRLWRHLVVFFSLRLMLAPVIETLILLDRLMFLHEHAASCALFPLFNSLVSPRNFVIVGVKKSPDSATVNK